MTSKFLWLTLVMAIVFSIIALATWDIPAPTAEVVKTHELEDFLNSSKN